MNILPLATYSKKHHWYMSIDPMKNLYAHLAHEIKTEIDKEMINAIRGIQAEKSESPVKDGIK